jgi:homocysteine S-methyltransferase
VARFNRLGVARMRASLTARRASLAGAADVPLWIAADVGPRGDGYQVPPSAIGVNDALDYHARQLEALARSEVDLVCALTMTTANEAAGIALAAGRQGLPVVVSATVETDGRLPDGMSLGDFIQRVDELTSFAPAFYMVNCAHPTHLGPELDRARAAGEHWVRRLLGFRANASHKSHAELDESTSLDRGDPVDLARRLALMQKAHGLRVIGGCCGTDAEHISCAADALASGVTGAS